MKKGYIIFFVFVLYSFAIYNVNNDRCSRCKMPLQRQSDFKIEWGKMVYLYKCINNHEYWLPDKTHAEIEKEEKKSGIKSCICPVCNMNGYQKSTLGGLVGYCVNNHEFNCE